MIFSKGNILKKIFFTVLIILLLFVGVLIIQYNFDISNEVSKTLEVSDKLNNSDLVYYFLYTLQESSLFFDFEFTTVKYFISLSVILSGFIISSLRLIIIKIFLVLFNFTSDVLIKCNVSIGHISDTLLKITDSVGKALFWFITVWSLKLAFIIIYYPNYVGDIFNNVFTTLHVLTFTWLSLSLISSAKGEYLKIKKGKRVRVEKVEFIFFTIKLLFVVSVILIISLTLWKDQLYVLTTLGVASATALFFILNNDNLGGSYFATRLIVFNENVKVGDWIVVNEIEGTVNKIDIFETEIRLFDQSMLTISNSELKKHIIINKSRREVRRIKFDFKIPIENSTESVTTWIL